MKIKRVRRFIKRVARERIPVKYVSNKKLQDCYIAFCDGESIILNRTFFHTASIIVKLSILMHEIGHFKAEVGGSQPIKEFNAQMWAIERAKKLGWKRVEKNLEREIESKWQEYSWNEHGGKCRCYIGASKIYRSIDET